MFDLACPCLTADLISKTNAVGVGTVLVNLFTCHLGLSLSVAVIAATVGGMH